LKWNVREEQHGAKGLAAALGFYVELPTGDPTDDLGSGVVDVWAYLAVERHSTPRPRFV